MTLISIIEQDGSTVLAEITHNGILLSVIANVQVVNDHAVLSNFHIDGPGPRQFGIGGLRDIIHKVMEYFDVEVLEIQGFRRTTGAVPGRTPGPLVFRR